MPGITDWLSGVRKKSDNTLSVNCGSLPRAYLESQRPAIMGYFVPIMGQFGVVLPVMLGYLAFQVFHGCTLLGCCQRIQITTIRALTNSSRGRWFFTGNCHIYTPISPRRTQTYTRTKPNQDPGSFELQSIFLIGRKDMDPI